MCWVYLWIGLGRVTQNGPMDNSASPLTLLYFGCDFSGWYNFWKIINTVATRCHILKLKCTKFDFDAGGVYNAPPDSLAGFSGAYF